MNIEERRAFLEEKIHSINMDIMNSAYNVHQRNSAERQLQQYQKELMKINNSISLGKPIKVKQDEELKKKTTTIKKRRHSR